MRRSRLAWQRPRLIAAISAAALGPLALLVPAVIGDTGVAAAAPAPGYTASLIPTSQTSSWVALDPATKRVYFAGPGSHLVIVVDTATKAVTGTIALSGIPQGIAVDAITNTLYATVPGATTTSAPIVDVIDGTTDAVSTTVTLPVGSHPTAVAVDSATDTVYVAEPGAGGVAVIDGSTNSVTTTVSTGSGTHPLALAVDEASDVIWVGDATGDVLA